MIKTFIVLCLIGMAMAHFRDKCSVDSDCDSTCLPYNNPAKCLENVHGIKSCRCSTNIVGKRASCDPDECTKSCQRFDIQHSGFCSHNKCFCADN